MTSPISGWGRGTPIMNSGTSRAPTPNNPSYINYMDFIPIYSGEEGKGPNVSTFFQTFSEIAKETGWTSVVSKHVLRTKLSGQALKFFDNNPRIQMLRDIADIRRIMIKQFGSVKSEVSELRKFLDCTQMRNEAVKDYALRLELMRESINAGGVRGQDVRIGDDMLFNVFQDGLIPSIGDKLIMFDPSDYESCLSAAEKIEAKMEQQHNRNRKVLLVDRKNEHGSVDGMPNQSFGGKYQHDRYANDNSNSLGESMSKLSLGSDSRDYMGDLERDSFDHDYRSSMLIGGASKGESSKGIHKTEDNNDRSISCRPKFFDSSMKTEKYKKATISGTKMLVKISIGKKVVKALLDSASDVCLIAIELMRELGLMRHIYDGEQSKVMGTCQGVLTSNKYIDLRFRFDKHRDTFCHTFHVVSADQILGYKIIVGSDFIISTEGIIDVARGMFIIYKDTLVPIEKVKSSDSSSAILSVIGVSEDVKTDSKCKEHKVDNMTVLMDGVEQLGTKVDDVSIQPSCEVERPELQTPSGKDKNVVSHCKNDSSGTKPSTLMEDKQHEVINQKGNGEMVRAVYNYAYKHGGVNISLDSKQEKKKQLLLGLTTHLGEVKDKQEHLRSIVENIQEIFAVDTLDLGLIKGCDHEVKVTSNKPISVKQFTIPESLKGKLAQKLVTYLEAGIIEPSTSAWNSPIIVKAKKNGEVRLVLDAKAINAVTTRIDYPMVEVKSVLSKLGGCKYFTILDMESGYHQVKLVPNSRELFAFRSPWGKFQFVRLPMGAMNSGLHFQKVMEGVLSEVLGDEVFVFQDVLVATESMDRHLELLERVFSLFKERGISVKLNKCELMKENVKFLGHQISAKGVTMSKENVASIVNSKRPTNKKTVRRFIGKIRFYSGLIPDLTNKINHIQILLKGRGEKIIWTHDATLSFEEIKQVIGSYPILRYPDFCKEFRLTVANNDTSIAATLEQEFDDGIHPIGFYSRTLKGSEHRYSNIEKEAMGIVDALSHFEHIVFGLPTKIISDHNALEYLRSLKDGNSRVTKWITRMLKNSPEFVKKDKDSDAYNDLMLEQVVEGQEEENIHPSVGNSIHTIPVIYTDGSCRMNGREGASAGIGYHISGEAMSEVSGRITGKQTNNRAELLAAICALKKAIELGHIEVIIRSDSKYMIENMNKNISRWEEKGYVNYKNKPIENIEEFKELSELSKSVKVTWEYVKAHEGEIGNERADQLAVEGALKPELCSSLVMSMEKDSEEMGKIRIESVGNRDKPFPLRGIMTYISAHEEIRVKGTILVEGRKMIVKGVPYIREDRRKDLIREMLEKIPIAQLDMGMIIAEIIDVGFWAQVRKDVERELIRIIRRNRYLMTTINHIEKRVTTKKK